MRPIPGSQGEEIGTSLSTSPPQEAVESNEATLSEQILAEAEKQLLKATKYRDVFFPWCLKMALGRGKFIHTSEKTLLLEAFLNTRTHKWIFTQSCKMCSMYLF